MAAAERECEEEAGIIPTNVKSLGVHNVIHGFVGYTDHDNVLIRATHGIIENDAWEWIDKEEIDKFVYADPNIPRMLHKVLRGSCQLPLSLIVVCNN
jgi:8-oxo-dGTP pyrophosphatase MutT (NUDIX family)